MTTPRRVIARQTYVVTRRCTQRQYLLRPDPMIRQIYSYCLAEAANRHAVTINGFVAMSNHSHLVVRDNLGNLPTFMAHLHRTIAKAVNAYWGRGENFWATAQPNAVYLVGAEDRFMKLAYVHANPVAAHLVERAAEWPGASSFAQHLSGEAELITRPKGFFRSDGPMPSEVELRVERVEGFETLTDAQWKDRVASSVHALEVAAREERAQRNERVVGRAGVLNASPMDSPKSIERRGGCVPQIACRDVERRVAVLDELRRFRAAYREASRSLRNGDPDAEFPEGTYGIWKPRDRSS